VHLSLLLSSERVVLQDQLGIQQRIAVFHQRAEKGNFIVLLRKNVSLVVKPVIPQSVTMMVFVVGKRAVSVVIV